MSPAVADYPVRRWGLIAIMAVLSGCALLPEPVPAPPAVDGPTVIPIPEGAVRVEVGWHNEADEGYILTLAQGDTMAGYVQVDRCGSGSVSTDLTLPWKVGLGRSDEDAVERPEPTILESSQFGAGDQRILLRIDENGDLETEPLVGEAPFSPGNDC